jgi:hypothetical protein
VCAGEVGGEVGDSGEDFGGLFEEGAGSMSSLWWGWGGEGE